MSPVLILLIWIDVAAIGVAAYFYLRGKARRDVLDAVGGVERNRTSRVIKAPDRPLGAVGQQILQRAPTVWTQDASIKEQLVHAGYDGQYAPAVYAVARVASLVLLPLLALIFGPHDSLIKTFVFVAAAG